MWTIIILAFICVTFRSGRAQEQTDYRLVTIADQGEIKGYRAPNHNVFTFYNVPYATAPVNENRYKAPLPPPVWAELHEAVNRHIVCPQDLTVPNENLNMVEDCLVANIYVPDTEETDLPVLVIVHGGAFRLGYGAMSEPLNLVDSKKIITVTFNYRLGVHGFLCLGTEHAPGNAGLKDQVALLQWVQKNIATFGGNPNDVTVSGCSAGGASVDLLILSKSTNGLMKQVIAESGNNVGVFALQFDPLKNAKEFAATLNFNGTDDVSALTEFYKSLSIESVLKYSATESKDSSIIFTGCLEKDVGQEIFLDIAPFDILTSRNYTRLPMYYGFTNMEGSLRYPYFNEWQTLMNEKFSDFLPADLEFESEEQEEEIAAKAKQFYFGDNNVSPATLLQYLEYFSDVMFIHGMLRSVSLQVQAGNNDIYLYEYSFARSDMPIVSDESISGAAHCVQYDAIMDEDEASLPQDYLNRKELLRDLWNNFIRTGNPTPAGWNSSYPTWLPAGRDRSPHYSLGQNDVILGGVALKDRAAFWDPIYEAHYRKPKIPSASTVNTLSISLLVMYILQMLAKLF